MALILIVDDEPFARNALARELESRFEVLLANSYRDALDGLAGPDGDRVCAVVTDCHMGAGLPTGLDLLAHVRNSIPEVKRVLVSGSVTHADGREHARSGLAHRCFGKPWQAGAICDAVLALLPLTETADTIPA